MGGLRAFANPAAFDESNDSGVAELLIWWLFPGGVFLSFIVSRFWLFTHPLRPSCVYSASGLVFVQSPTAHCPLVFTSLCSKDQHYLITPDTNPNSLSPPCTSLLSSSRLLPLSLLSQVLMDMDILRRLAMALRTWSADKASLKAHLNVARVSDLALLANAARVLSV